MKNTFLLHSKRGVLLIDVMLTVSIVAVIGIIFSSTLPTGFKCTKQSKEYSTAISIAQRKMEQIKSMNFESLNSTLLLSSGIIDNNSTSDNLSFTQVDNITSYLPGGSGEIQITNTSDTIKKVVIAINWTNNATTDQRHTELTTLITDKRPREVNEN